MICSTDEFRELLKAARRAGTPLVAIRTADPASAIAQVSASIGEQSALLIWDHRCLVITEQGVGGRLHVFGRDGRVDHIARDGVGLADHFTASHPATGKDRGICSRPVMTRSPHRT